MSLKTHLRRACRGYAGAKGRQAGAVPCAGYGMGLYSGSGLGSGLRQVQEKPKNLAWGYGIAPPTPSKKITFVLGAAT